MVKRIFIIFFLFFIFNLKAKELTWKDCVNETLNKNPEVLSAKAKLNQEKANAWVAKSSIFPQISASASASRSGIEISSENTNKTGSYGVTYSNSYSTSFSYGISGKQVLFNGFQTLNNINKSNVEVEIAEINYKITSANIRYKLRQAFVNLLKAQELVNITEDILSSREKQFLDIKLRYEAGKEHKGSYLNAEASFLQAQFENEQAKKNFILAQYELAKELGEKDFSDLKVKSDFILTIDTEKQPDFDDLLQKNYEYILLLKNKKIAEYLVASAFGAFWPSVSLVVNLAKSDDVFPTNDNLNWSVGINISLSILDGGLLFSKKNAADENLKQAKMELEYGEKDIFLKIQKSWYDFIDMLNSCKIQEKFLNAAKERAKIADIQYSNGLLSFDNWIIIQDNLVNLKKSYLNSQINLLLYEALWIKIKGGTLEDEKI